ncbi:MAG: hypothetical protein LBI41_00045 [Lactobacillales bacterium]|nr:hypothetical protein [Lactobacillales bacterium]
MLVTIYLVLNVNLLSMHWNYSKNFWQERYSFNLENQFGILASGLEAALEIAIVFSYLKNYWDIYTLTKIRKPHIQHMLLGFRFSFPAVMIILATNLFFDFIIHRFNLLGIISLLFFYLMIIFFNNFIHNKKSLLCFAISFVLACRFAVWFVV